uniref:Uncharacterized protein n=1 Tax=Romanomermis culicivorax TaxID=13658 RepID=A0A915JMI0_ROMCU
MNDSAQKLSAVVRDDAQNDESIVERWEDIVNLDGFIPSLSQKVVSDFGLTGTPETIDYLKFDFKKSVTLENDHVLEAYGFPASYRTIDDLKSAFQFECTVDLVDDSHALIILDNRDIAFKALQYAHPVIKLRTLHDATAQSKRKAKENAAQMKPFKARPETNAFLARRLVESHLGKKSAISSDARKQERVNIQSARETKRIVAQLKEDSWLGLN